MTVKRIGKGKSLAFFLNFIISLACFNQALDAQSGAGADFPLIVRLDSRDIGFKQYISDVESNRRRLFDIRGLGKPVDIAERLTIFRYAVLQGDDIFSLAARCNIPYSTIASLNRLNSTAALETGRFLLLPSCPGIFLAEKPLSQLEMLLSAGRSQDLRSVELKINTAGRTENFRFFPGADFSATERVFFLNSGFFRFPLQSYRVTSTYGIRANPVTGNITMHQGLDLAAPEGTEVFAAADGTVIDIGFDAIYGNYIIISHKEKWTSLYGHLKKVDTHLNEELKSGTLIGRVGSTGQSTGPHLHFELRQDGRALNPAGRLRP